MKNIRGQIVLLLLIFVIVFFLYQAFNYTNKTGDLQQQSRQRVTSGIIGGVALGYLLGVFLTVLDTKTA